MEILAAIVVSLIIGAACGTILSRPAAITAIRRDLTQMWLWLLSPIPVTDPEPEYVGRHRIKGDLEVLKEVIDDAMEPAAV